jgi:hypothetical protein
MVKDDPRIWLVGVRYKEDLEKRISFYMPKSPAYPSSMERDKPEGTQ